MRVQPMELPQLVALVNDWGTVPRQVGDRAMPPSQQSLGGAAKATAVADRLHAVFAAADAAERARLVNAMLAEATVRPEVAAEDGALSTAWSVPGSPTALLASAALALRGHLAAHPDRLGVCADRQCADVYVDASPAGHRRFCSLTCQNRTRVAAFRERRRSTR
jgi:predicted RNA-binding Zn ribbon-like protein